MIENTTIKRKQKREVKCKKHFTKLPLDNGLKRIYISSR